MKSVLHEIVITSTIPMSSKVIVAGEPTPSQTTTKSVFMRAAGPAIAKAKELVKEHDDSIAKGMGETLDVAVYECHPVDVPPRVSAWLAGLNGHLEVPKRRWLIFGREPAGGGQ